MKVTDIQKGDIIYYCNGRINNVNKPYQYHRYFNDNFKNIDWWGFDIIKIQRYVKVLWFYRLKTIYRRYADND